ncbi:hypothetical protein CYMTET_27719 [Cymbomonas tetramitiformis]|uniref:Uncharacterized protein n=1 Tax=Cymbomonas tetramitiformis TaxID=36881 RepID=A0AAE0KWN0_9CHLO|nr:hypothetical protein CYMTET_27719 [Cymbomonas tetramitiformis]
MSEQYTRLVLFFIVLLWGVIKGFLTATLATCICTTFNLGAALGYLPRHVYLIARTAIVGPALKALLNILAPVVMYSWLMLVLVISHVSSFAYGFSFAVFTTMSNFLDSKEWMELELVEPVRMCKKLVQAFNDFCACSIPACFEDDIRVEGERIGNAIDLPFVWLVENVVSTIFTFSSGMIRMMVQILLHPVILALYIPRTLFNFAFRCIFGSG